MDSPWVRSCPRRVLSAGTRFRDGGERLRCRPWGPSGCVLRRTAAVSGSMRLRRSAAVIRIRITFSPLAVLFRVGSMVDRPGLHPQPLPASNARPAARPSLSRAEGAPAGGFLSPFPFVVALAALGALLQPRYWGLPARAQPLRLPPGPVVVPFPEAVGARGVPGLGGAPALGAQSLGLSSGRACSSVSRFAFLAALAALGSVPVGW